MNSRGSRRKKLIELAELYADPARKLISFWTMGFNQHTRGTWVNEQSYMLHLLGGKKISTPGSGAFSLTGQPSACGTAREVGTFAHRLPADLVVTNPAHRARCEKLWKLPAKTLNPKVGTHAVKMVRSLRSGEVRFFWAMVADPFAGLRLPYLIFFGEPRSDAETFAAAADPPWNMQLAMLVAALLCLVIGTWYPLLYSLLPNQDALYHPYSGYHLSETLQILGFTALGFMLFKDRILARATISLDLDWFYRRGGQAFQWLAEKPIQWLDTAWGEAYRFVGLGSLMTTAKFWAWFDWHGIDGVLDGSARAVRSFGRLLARTLQRGQIQQTLCYTVSFVAIVLLIFIWM